MVEIKLGDLVERITKIEGSDLPPTKQIVCIDEEMMFAFEELENANEEIKKIFSYLSIEYTKVWRYNGKDYILIWEENDESRSN